MIELKDICKSYRIGENKLQVLNNINIAIKSVEFVALKGISGSGKTTLLNIIGVLDSADSGTIEINGENVTELSSKEKFLFRAKTLGFVFQDYNLIPELNIYENVEIPLLIANESNREEKIISIIERVGLLSHLKHKPCELSGGQMQRVSIARALVKKPPLVLADEPTANLDSKTGYSIIDLMRELNQEFGVTFIMATHDSYVLENIEKFYHLVDGKIQQV